MSPGAFSQNQAYKSTIQDYMWHFNPIYWFKCVSGKGIMQRCVHSEAD